jgi:hypothetical protein
MPKKRVPDPKICHGLKNDRATLGMAAILALSCKWAILPLPMHAIDTSYHPQKSSFLIDRQQPSSVLNNGLSKIDGAKNRYHRSAELVHRLKAGGLAHSQVLIHEIIGHSICKHAYSCRTFLIGSEAKLAGGIGPGSEVVIVRPHSIQNYQEQLP